MLEVGAFLLIIAVILSVVMPNYIWRINKAKYDKTIIELSAITQASVDYFISEGSWPPGISQLAPGFMPNVPTLSPFGTIYQINCVNNVVTASVLIPSGIAQKNPQGQLLVVINQGNQDQIEISQTVQNDVTSRLSYDLKYVY